MASGRWAAGKPIRLQGVKLSNLAVSSTEAYLAPPVQPSLRLKNFKGLGFMSPQAFVPEDGSHETSGGDAADVGSKV
jgi:hypothetical protein